MRSSDGYGTYVEHAEADNDGGVDDDGDGDDDGATTNDGMSSDGW